MTKATHFGDAYSKLFSLSTLGAIASSVEGPTHKHHSYPNTSKVAGQSAIEAYGARSDFHDVKDMEQVLDEVDLLMTSCHNTRTLHTLSHRLRGETVNHAVGPLAFTMSHDTGLIAMIGVNEKIHPELVAESLQILSRRGFQAYGNSAVFCGTDLTEVPADMLDAATYGQAQSLKQHVRIDEIAPPPYSSLVAFSRNSQPQGTYVLSPEDFYPVDELQEVCLSNLAIPNTAEAILHNNNQALTGRDLAKTRYLAMTVGLGIFTRKYLDLPDALDFTTRKVNSRYLREATAHALAILTSGRASQKLSEYVEATQKHAGK